MKLFVPVFVFALMFSTPAPAPPLVGWIAGAMGAIGFSAATAMAIATYAVNALINVGVSLLANAIFGQKNSAVARGITTMVREPVASQKIIYGTRRASGPIVYIESTGKNGKYLHLVIVLAAHECNDITDVYFDDELVWSSGVYQGNWATFARINTHLGSVSQAADADLIAESGGYWTTSHRLQGHAYLYVRLKYNQNKFSSGIPNISALVEGRKVYDPRDGSTSFSSNPALCLRDYMFDSKHGIGIDSDEWDEAACIALANLSDEAVTTLDGNTQTRFAMNAAIDTAANHSSVLEAMLVQVLGGITYTNGQFSIFGAEYRTPSISLSEADIVGPTQIQTAISRRQHYNGVKGVFSSALNNYINDEYPAVLSSAYELSDGDPQYLSVDFPFETDAERAQRNAKLLLNKSRQKITFTAPFKLTAFDLVPGDNVSITMDRYGWSSKIFEVLSVDLNIHDVAPSIQLSLRETASGVYDWTASDADPYLAGPSTSLPDPLDISIPTFVVSDELKQQGGGVVTALVVDLSAYESVFLSKFVVEAKLATDAEWTTIGSGLQSKFEWSGVIDGAVYDVRAQVVTLLGAKSDYYQKQHTVIGANAAPADVTGFGVDIIDSAAVLKWDPVPDLDLSHYRIKFQDVLTGATWATAIDLAPRISSTTATLPAKAGTYLIKAVDHGGRESQSATLIVSNVVGLLDLNVVDTIIEGPAFSGVKTNTALVSGAIQLADSVLWSSVTDLWSTRTDNWGTVSAYYSTGYYDFAGAIDLGSTFVSRIGASLAFTRADSSTFWSQDERIWSETTELWSGNSTQTADVAVVVQIRTTDDDPSGTPTWSDWSDLIVGDYTCRAMEFRAKLTTDRDKVTPQITALSVTVDMPDRVFSAADISTGGSAKVVSFVPEFSVTPDVVISGQDLATGDYWAITSKSASGCTITFYNSSNTIIDRTFDLVAKGYGAVQT